MLMIKAVKDSSPKIDPTPGSIIRGDDSTAETCRTLSNF
jgi:hypothetical protein